jgi:2-oxoglutarate dehydrogenase E2 component (dihydrolipoamide succinyltransferase)
MSFTVTMPQLGETVTEGTILRWVKQLGETVAEDDVLLEISTDKVDTEVPSPFAGTMLEILVAEGETVDVGTALCVIGEPGEAAGAPAAPAAEPVAEVASPPPAVAPVVAEPVAAAPAPTSSTPSTPAPTTDSADLGVLSPVVRKLAAGSGVNLAMVAGSGRGGRITRRDVEDAIAAGPGAEVEVEVTPAAPEAPVAPVEVVAPTPAVAPVEVVTPTPAVAPTPVPVTEAPAPAPEVRPAAAASGDRVEELDRLRTRIAGNLIRAKQTAAHVWTSMEVDFEHLERIRQKRKAAFKEREGFSLTYLPFISRAVMDALSEYPVVNSSLDLEAGTRTFHGAVNLGISVDLNQEGLVVMTIRGADGLRMRGIAREVKRLADKARGGKMEPDDVAGSTFTITNPGPFGSYMSAPIINIPNVAILSTDGIKKRPVVVTDKDGNDAIAIHHVGFLGLTWDHRAFDGSTAVLFLQRIKENLETWDWEQELA